LIALKNTPRARLRVKGRSVSADTTLRFGLVGPPQSEKGTLNL
jgi:hypothetical protein